MKIQSSKKWTASGTESSENRNSREIAELRAGLETLHIEYHKADLEKFRRYLEVLDDYRNKIHLISHQDYTRVSKKHFLPSLLALPYVKGVHHACDIGAGAGFPSIPLKIFTPDLNLILFESVRKKAEFLKYLVCELKLDNVQIVNERAENYPTAAFDLVLIRAAGKIKKLVKVIDRLVSANGCAIFYKTCRTEDEVKIAQSEIEKRKFVITVKELRTPLENQPLALVILKRQ